MTKSWPTIFFGIVLAFLFAKRPVTINGRAIRPEPVLIAPAFVDLSSKALN